MIKSLPWFISRIVIIIFAYILIYFAFKGLTSNYYEGDSLNYHIPIAKSYLDKTIISPQLINGERFLKFSPGINEGILAGQILLKIPMNVFNIFGLVALFFVCFFAGRRFLLEKDMAIIFAGSVVTLHTMSRWINTQIIDIWLAVWFVLVLALLQKPVKTLKYFAFLGFACGMLIGSKYSGPIFLMILALFYIKNIWKYLNLKRFLIFLLPFLLFGSIWYLRNYLITGNPLYPQGFLFFKDAGFKILNVTVWKATFLYPNGVSNFINAIISEYGLWSITFFVPVLLFIKKIRKTKFLNIILIGTLCLFVFFFLPSDKHYNIAVSVFRYSFPAFITLILSLFLLAQNYKKEAVISIYALTNFLIIPELVYKPKLILILLPIVFIVFYPKEILGYIKNKSLLINK